MQICRIRLSDKTSRLHPRRAASQLCQPYEPEMPVKVREWISSALASPDLVLEAQPPAQPHSRVVVERPIRFAYQAPYHTISSCSSSPANVSSRSTGEADIRGLAPDLALLLDTAARLARA